MNLEHYAAGQRDRYADFAKAVAQILSAAIRKNAQLRLQQIQDRAKQSDSLKAKLVKAGLLESDAIEDEIKDLAGSYKKNSCQRQLWDRDAWPVFRILAGSFEQKYSLTILHP